eukprot:scaffold10.g2346.t1
MEAATVMFVLDAASELGHVALQEAVLRFASCICLQPGIHRQKAVRVGLASLGRTNALQAQVRVKLRPSPLSLKELHTAVAKLPRGEGPPPDSAQIAMGLNSLLGALAANCAPAVAGSVALLVLTDRLYEPEGFEQLLEVSKGRGVELELVVACCSEHGAAALDVGALLGWQALEARHPHFALSVVEAADQLGLNTLASALLNRVLRGAPAWAAPVSLQARAALAFKLPLVGEVRTLTLQPFREVCVLDTSAQHGLLCPCHGQPTAPPDARALACCPVTGAPLPAQQCVRDAQVVQVGTHPGATLRFDAPFNISADQATVLSVTLRVKREGVNLALLHGEPLLLRAAPGGVKLLVDGQQLCDVSTMQLLGLVVASLREAGEVLVASSTTDLDSGAPGLFRRHYLLQPCATGPAQPPMLWASKLASAEEVVRHGALWGSADEAEVPAAVRQSVLGQLAKVLVAEALAPEQLTSRCHETLAMLVREARALAPPPPAASAPPAGPRAPPAQGEGQRPEDQDMAPVQPEEQEGQRPAGARGGGAPAGGALVGPAAPRLAVGSGRRRGARGGAAKGGLELKRVAQQRKGSYAIFSADDDCRLKAWRLALTPAPALKHAATLQTDGCVTCLELEPESALLAAGGREGAIRVFCARALAASPGGDARAALRCALRGHSRGVLGLSWRTACGGGAAAGADAHLASCARDGSIRIWRVQPSGAWAELAVVVDAPCTSLAWMPGVPAALLVAAAQGGPQLLDLAAIPACREAAQAMARQQQKQPAPWQQRGQRPPGAAAALQQAAVHAADPLVAAWLPPGWEAPSSLARPDSAAAELAASSTPPHHPDRACSLRSESASPGPCQQSAPSSSSGEGEPAERAMGSQAPPPEAVAFSRRKRRRGPAPGQQQQQEQQDHLQQQERDMQYQQQQKQWQWEDHQQQRQEQRQQQRQPPVPLHEQHGGGRQGDSGQGSGLDGAAAVSQPRGWSGGWLPPHRQAGSPEAPGWDEGVPPAAVLAGYADCNQDGSPQWDAATRSYVPRFVGHAAAVQAVAALPNGLHVMTAAADGLRLWRADSGRGLAAMLPERAEREAAWGGSAAPACRPLLLAGGGVALAGGAASVCAWLPFELARQQARLPLRRGAGNAAAHSAGRGAAVTALAAAWPCEGVLTVGDAAGRLTVHVGW